LAIQLVIEASKHGVEFEWISTDSLYGKDAAFFLLRMMDRMHKTFVADVAKSQLIYLEDPEPAVLPPTSKKGQKASRCKAQQ
jgi:hypothetical protein